MPVCPSPQLGASPRQGDATESFLNPRKNWRINKCVWFAIILKLLYYELPYSPERAFSKFKDQGTGVIIQSMGFWTHTDRRQLHDIQAYDLRWISQSLLHLGPCLASKMSGGLTEVMYVKFSARCRNLVSAQEALDTNKHDGNNHRATRVQTSEKVIGRLRVHSVPRAEYTRLSMNSIPPRKAHAWGGGGGRGRGRGAGDAGWDSEAGRMHLYI